MRTKIIRQSFFAYFIFTNIELLNMFGFIAIKTFAPDFIHTNPVIITAAIIAVVIGILCTRPVAQ